MNTKYNFLLVCIVMYCEPLQHLAQAVLIIMVNNSTLFMVLVNAWSPPSNSTTKRIKSPFKRESHTSQTSVVLKPFPQRNDQ